MIVRLDMIGVLVLVFVVGLLATGVSSWRAGPVQQRIGEGVVVPVSVGIMGPLVAAAIEVPSKGG